MIIEYRNFHIKEYEGQIIMQAAYHLQRSLANLYLPVRMQKRYPDHVMYVKHTCALRRSFRPPGDEGGGVGSPALLS